MTDFMDPKLNAVQITPEVSELEDSGSRKPTEYLPFLSPSSVFSVPGCVIMATLALKVTGDKKHFPSCEEWAPMVAHVLSDVHQRLAVETTKSQPEMQPADGSPLKCQPEEIALWLKNKILV